jgi:hypothetical protein
VALFPSRSTSIDNAPHFGCSAQLMQIGWRTVGGICKQAWASVAERVDLLAGLRCR